ncbi:Crp/Fnr family transcriptional regulator [Methylocystis bryophila]|uniref:Crp/Fnr family transcriptional regulator n=1 Tax=Methylocystis bryophila TaxID=655015 RepID=UPI001FD91A3B|nr:Crp/Fnr family transcriptional regulator [Methylocystis bryophila]BDV39505.1 Crp/Fnr family transcriptional regulator [Methylocystis bryophila]
MARIGELDEPHLLSPALDEATKAALARRGAPLRAAAGAWIFRQGLPCEAYPIVVSGRIRVQKTGANGREITLYRVGPGETCVITTACLMRDAAYDAEAIAETDVTAKVLPKADFRELLASSASFRDFVFRTFSARLASLLARIEEVAFERIDRRLAQRLLDAVGEDGAIAATHRELAVELGTAREVVSRKLKDFERSGWIELHRGGVRLLQPEALRRIVHDEAAS